MERGGRKRAVVVKFSFEQFIRTILSWHDCKHNGAFGSPNILNFTVISKQQQNVCVWGGGSHCCLDLAHSRAGRPKQWCSGPFFYDKFCGRTTSDVLKQKFACSLTSEGQTQYTVVTGACQLYGHGKRVNCCVTLPVCAAVINIYDCSEFIQQGQLGQAYDCPTTGASQQNRNEA